MSTPKAPEVREIAAGHAAYNIAWGLHGLLCYANARGQEGHAHEGAEMLRNGIREALELLLSHPLPPDPTQERR